MQIHYSSLFPNPREKAEHLSRIFIPSPIVPLLPPPFSAAGEVLPPPASLPSSVLLFGDCS